jgi:hypothetical protein
MWDNPRSCLGKPTGNHVIGDMTGEALTIALGQVIESDYVVFRRGKLNGLLWFESTLLFGTRHGEIISSVATGWPTTVKRRGGVELCEE